MSSIFDPSEVNKFWENHAKDTISTNKPGLANLETDPKLAKIKSSLEQEKLSKYFEDTLNINNSTFFDIGCGYGEWSFFLKEKFKNIYAYENSPTMCSHMRALIKENNYKNINVTEADVSSIKFTKKFNFALLSGILIYLDDSRCNHLLKQLQEASESKAKIIIRDGTALEEEYLINGKYSEALNSNYYAIYRTKDQYISLMKKYGFELIKDEDMFKEGSPLNKWQNTRLRIYKFIKL
jgi:SAM-dependent methyltransferase